MAEIQIPQEPVSPLDATTIAVRASLQLESLEYDQIGGATSVGGMSAYNPDERVNGALVRAGSGPALPASIP